MTRAAACRGGRRRRRRSPVFSPERRRRQDVVPAKVGRLKGSRRFFELLKRLHRDGPHQFTSTNQLYRRLALSESHRFRNIVSSTCSGSSAEALSQADLEIFQVLMTI